MKKTILILAAAIMTMASCSDSKKLPDDGIYGEIPGIIQEIEDEMSAELDEKFGIKKKGDKPVLKGMSWQEALVMIYAMTSELVDKVHTATADACKKMKGNKDVHN